MDQYSAGEYGKFNDPRGYELKAEYENLMQERADKKGNLLTVRINAEPHEMLDWDKPLSEQSPQVQAAIKKMEGAGGEPEPANVPPEWRGQGRPVDYTTGDPTGAEIYARLSGLPRNAQRFAADVGNQQQASAALRAAGVKGIRYLDAGSRAHEVTLDGKPYAVPAPRVSMDTLPTEELALYAANRNGSVARGVADLRSPSHAADQRAAYEKAAQWLEENSDRIGFAEKPDATRNVVVFDHNDIEITHRNGEPVKPEAWNPERFYGKDQARSLEDLENEHRQEASATGAQQRARGAPDTGFAAAAARSGEEGGRSRSGGVGATGRDRTQEGQRGRPAVGRTAPGKPPPFPGNLVRD